MGLLKKLFGKKVNIRQREGSPDVYDMPSESERMNWAMEKARLTLHYFEECIANPKDGQSYMSIKARIEDNGKTEHIWLMEPSFDNDGNIFGTIGNDPIDVTNVKINENIGITINEVSDWMIVENGKLIGGYTIRAIRDGVSPSELPNFDKSLGGLYIDEGEDYFEVNFETPEGAILSLEEAYDNDDLEAAVNSKNFYKEAEFMLQKTVKFEIDEELITKTADILKMSFENSMNTEGMPKFTGIKRAFRRQFITDDHCVVSEICFYPDGGKSIEKLNTFRDNNQWKVLGFSEE